MYTTQLLHKNAICRATCVATILFGNRNVGANGLRAPAHICLHLRLNMCTHLLLVVFSSFFNTMFLNNNIQYLESHFIYVVACHVVWQIFPLFFLQCLTVFTQTLGTKYHIHKTLITLACFVLASFRPFHSSDFS